MMGGDSHHHRAATTYTITNLNLWQVSPAHGLHFQTEHENAWGPWGILDTVEAESGQDVGRAKFNAMLRLQRMTSMALDCWMHMPHSRPGLRPPLKHKRLVGAGTPIGSFPVLSRK